MVAVVRFPKTGERRRQWELALRRDGFVSSGRTLLCSEHFRSEDFDRTGQTVRLKDGVVPTVFNFPAHLQRPEATRSTTTSRRAEDEPQPNVVSILNVAKTREMVIDFRRVRTSLLPLCILGEDVAVVEDYKYLGVHLDNGLNWRINTDAVHKKGMSRLYFLRKLRYFHVCSKMLEIFYRSVVASALFFAVVCWGGSIRAGDTSRINKLIRKAGSVIGIKLDPFEAVVERRTLNRLLSIMDNPTHPLHLQLDSQRSSFSNRLLQLRSAITQQITCSIVYLEYNHVVHFTHI
ncbi:uncharacterized protein LOC117557164 [Gymnodraco acuticeps]|uniref:Uncharacterized protein LOC117557164 n=1 Tax=Gymnodraco acuticeps TaxID=8218 RepID=A0A6P8VPE9_GYMAC|nr:uncharacterized protein LOC117557164 [Gymnodraco acuticeps]